LPVDDVGILLDVDRKGDLEALRRAGDRAGSEQTLIERTFKDGQVSPSGSDRPELVIVGRDEMAIALAKLARVLRFTVTIVDPLLTIDEFSDADRVLRDLNFAALGDKADRHVVVASRGSCDEEAIEQALHARSAYVGLVANRKRGEEVLRGLQRKGVPQERLASVRVPAGVKIGAQGPEEIALSVLAEIISLRNQKEKGPQRISRAL
jgi:xanthine dehydrogenase accessory factor